MDRKIFSLKILENYHFWSVVGWKWKFRRSLTCWGSVNGKSFWLRQTSLFCSVSSTSTFSHSSFDRYLFYRSGFSGCWELNDFPHSATLMFIPSWQTLRSEIWFTELMISGLSVRDVKFGRRWFVGFQAVEWHLWHLRGQTIGEKNHLKWNVSPPNSRNTSLQSQNSFPKQNIPLWNLLMVPFLIQWLR